MKTFHRGSQQVLADFLFSLSESPRQGTVKRSDSSEVLKCWHWESLCSTLARNMRITHLLRKTQVSGLLGKKQGMKLRGFAFAGRPPGSLWNDRL